MYRRQDNDKLAGRQAAGVTPYRWDAGTENFQYAILSSWILLVIWTKSTLKWL